MSQRRRRGFTVSNSKKLRLRVSCVMHLNALGQQALASALAPARESCAATLCLHARTKTVLAFARAL
jgi:hypothetical protein